MNYLDKAIRELEKLLASGKTEEIVVFVRTKLLESFKNGLEKGKQSTQGAPSDSKKWYRRLVAN